MTNNNSLAIMFALLLISFSHGSLAAETRPSKAVLVTGANSGIGLRITEVLSSNGFHVYAGARKATDLERLKAMDNVTPVRLDVTIDEDIAAAVELIEQQGRGLWGIVNNAGIARYSSLLSGPESDFRFTLDINVLGPFRINQAFMPMVIDSKGRTAIIGSISGFVPSRNDGGYATSKFAVEGYTDSLALELADTGVHVAIVEPGSYKSRFLGKYAGHGLKAEGDLALDEETRKSLLGIAAVNDTLKDPLEVAQAVLHLMSSETPKRRYLVTPDAKQADHTMRVALARMLELNEDQPYSYTRSQLISLLDELLAAD
jgi:NAD(P)-dependent dehydrogenase (short-subunit alcohol dehydrogenase family)